jgi:hypothetical protein
MIPAQVPTKYRLFFKGVSWTLAQQASRRFFMNRLFLIRADIPLREPNVSKGGVG